MQLRAFILGGLGVFACAATAWGQGSPASLADQFTLGTPKNVVLKGTGASASLTLAPQADLTGWKSGPKLPGTVSNHTLLSSGNRLYLLGGQQGDNILADVYTATVGADGTVSAFTKASADAQLPEPRAFHGAALYNNILYVAGGDTGKAGVETDAFNSSVVTDSVIMSVIGADGQPGKWTETKAMPNVGDFMTVVADKGYLYATTSFVDPGAGTTIAWYAPIQADGSLGDWQDATNLPSTLKRFGAGGFALGDRIGLIGGMDFDTNLSIQVPTSDVETNLRSANGSLGSWSQGSPLPDSRGFVNNSTVMAGGQVYLIGGLNSSNVPVNSVLAAPVGAGGALGAWSSKETLPTGDERYAAAATAIGNLLIVTGGQIQGLQLIQLDTTDLGALAPGSGPVPFGTFDSPVMNLGKEDTIGKLEWTATVPPQASVQAQYRFAPKSGAFGEWSSPTGQSPIDVADKGQFLQYRLLLTASTGATPQSPEVTSFTRTAVAPNVLYGDVTGDGAVNVLDAVLTLRFSTRLVTPTDQQILAGDVAPKPGANGNPFGDGVINVLDAIRILRASVKLDTLP